jgi:deoxyribose-phosphate aldolase
MFEPKDNLKWIQIIETVQKDVKKLLQEHQTLPLYKLDGPIAKYIDHTQLKLDATESQIDSLCAEARKADFAVSTHLKHPTS